MQINVISRKNFGMDFIRQKNIEIEDNTVFEDCNFTQVMPFTETLKEKRNLIFRDCNLVNCKLPSDATVIGGIQQQISFCSHDNPEFMKHGLSECGGNCDHISTLRYIAGIFYPPARKYESQIIEE